MGLDCACSEVSVIRIQQCIHLLSNASGFHNASVFQLYTNFVCVELLTALDIIGLDASEKEKPSSP